MSEVMDTLVAESEKNDVKSVRKVFLEVGDLTFLGHEQLKFAYEILVEGTVFDGSELVIESKPALVKCSSCGYEGELKYEENPEFHLRLPDFSCPKCENPASIVSGNECIIRRMVADVED
ncbi:MAG: hydrogenase maturation nickel metallochaperone HypA [Methanobacteriota archaeon]|nr:MAG: hydrogenase maturation nickel metallochaperone HypA [Euryarchaeota archaeon]